MTAALSLPQREVWTVDDLSQLPPDLPYELVNGRLLLMSPTFIHQFVCTEIAFALRTNCPDGWAPVVDLSLDVNRYSEPRPDVVVMDTSHVDQHPPPVEDAVLAVEVVSKDSNVRDVYDKAGMYAAAGVRHYWVIDPLGDKISLAEHVLESKPHRRYAIARQTTEVFTTDEPYRIVVDLPALTARRDAFLARTKVEA
ncbi:Uma2 family endonuclease [Phytohabitans sp. ZYX-F-186]|uniref:Uma2 family endonuclease n=1 Tax=Phytohabitans maris TaxID=3071409 RepID=A0ABU0ZV47_9ACTN|nr:Uma2 family endonuclease [Phytohabitans sp. ZYX-F-186]MDQ7910919.1 Uma2 family endonuclease [Phytohabitans sp. ZYX-F-186]